MNKLFGFIGFERLKISCVIGVLPHERHTPQDLFVDLKVETELSKSALSDELDDAVDYVKLAAICREIALEGNYFLIEKYAAEVLNKICEKYPVKSAWICVRKPGALAEAVSAFVELKKERT